MLVAHLIKLINTAAALVSQHQRPGLQGIVSRPPLLGQGDLISIKLHMIKHSNIRLNTVTYDCGQDLNLISPSNRYQYI